MKKLSKVFNPKHITTFLIIILLLGGIKALFDFAKNSMPGFNYEIISYNSDVNIKNDNKFSVSDTFTINFNDTNVNIIYNIPLRDGDNKFNLLNIEISDNIEYDVKKTKDNYSLTFHNKYNIGSQDIAIKYLIDKGNDYNYEKDYIIHNLYNLDTNNEVPKFSFTINYPHNISKTPDLYIEDERVNDKFDLKYNGAYIIGELKSNNSIRSAVMFNIDLNEGYFINQTDYKMINGMVISLYIICTIIFFVLWFLKGKDDRIVSNPTFTAPNDMNPMEIGYWENQDIEYNEIFNMILYWANKGYIKIIKNSDVVSVDDISKVKIGDYTFIKVKEMDINTHEYEKLIFKAFFELGNEDDTPGNFNVKEFLKETSSLYGTLQTYAQDLYNAEEVFREENKRSEKEGQDKGAEALFDTMKVLTFVLWGVAIFFYSELSFGTLMNFLPIILVLLTVFMGLFLQKDTFYGYMIYALPVLLVVSFTTVNIFVLILLMIITILTASVRKRTFEYNELLGKIRGFSNVIGQNKYNKEVYDIVNEDNMYFYEIMPYALTLKLEREWIKRFEVISSPFWYESFDNIPLSKSNIVEFIDDMKELCMAILLNVNNSATANKRTRSVEEIEYIDKRKHYQELEEKTELDKK